MGSVQAKSLSDITIEEIMIPSEKVAHVQLNNPLEHALLVLVKAGYSAVPVLDVDYKLVGMIRKTLILNEILGIERFEIEKLSEMRVHEVVNMDIPRLKRYHSFIDGMNMVINQPFVCVVDDDGYFDGIVTRRAILKQLKKDYYTRG